MQRKEPSAPDSFGSEQPLADAFRQLKSISEKLLTACHNKQISRVEEYLNKREAVIQTLQRSSMQGLSVDVRQEIEANLATVRSLEPLIDQEMQAIRNDLDAQLQTLMDSKHGVSQYRLETEETDQTLSHDA